MRCIGNVHGSQAELSLAQLLPGLTYCTLQTLILLDARITSHEMSVRSALQRARPPADVGREDAGPRIARASRSFWEESRVLLQQSWLEALSLRGCARAQSLKHFFVGVVLCESDLLLGRRAPNVDLGLFVNCPPRGQSETCESTPTRHRGGPPGPHGRTCTPYKRPHTTSKMSGKPNPKPPINFAKPLTG